MKTYQEAEQYYLDQISGAQQGGGTALGVAYLNLANFYYYCAFNLWTFEFNRAPNITETPAGIKFGTIDAFYDFFVTIPVGNDYHTLYEKAEGAYLKALPLFESNKKQQASIYIQLNYVYDQLNRMEESKKSLESAYELYTEIHDQDGLVTVILQRAYNERYRTYDMKKAEEYLWEAYKVFEAKPDKAHMADCLVKIADIYHPVSVLCPDITKWEKYNTDAIALFLEVEEKEAAVRVMITMTEYYKDHDEKKEAEYLKRVKDLGFTLE